MPRKSTKAAQKPAQNVKAPPRVVTPPQKPEEKAPEKAPEPTQPAPEAPKEEPKAESKKTEAKAKALNVKIKGSGTIPLLAGGAMRRVPRGRSIEVSKAEKAYLDGAGIEHTED